MSDGYCDAGNNNDGCSYDGGDCCEATCVVADYGCNVANQDCLDPDAGGEGRSMNRLERIDLSRNRLSGRLPYAWLDESMCTMA